MKTKIKAEIVAHSSNQQGDELISVLCTFPRIILAEINTHRMLSKNTSSSRAIPFSKMVESVQNDPFVPIAWQKKHSGMQGSEYHIGEAAERFCPNNWLRARDRAVLEANHLHDNIGVTKQLANRLLEPFMWTTMLITGSREGWDNFFKLRCPQYQFKGSSFFESKKDCIGFYPETEEFTQLDWLKLNTGYAEIHIMALAECIWDSVNESTPKQLESGQWHVPFIDRFESYSTKEDGSDFDFNDIKISVAMAARTSYTVVGEEKEIDYEAMIKLHDRLLAQDPPHSSPLEHCCRAMTEEEYLTFIKGKLSYQEIIEEDDFDDTIFFSGLDRNNKAAGWCNNIKGFIPYRYMVDNGSQI